MLYKWDNKAGMIAHLFTTRLPEYFKLTAWGKKIPFKIFLLIDNVPCYPRALMEMYTKISVVFMPANTASILEPVDQGVVSIFRAASLRNTFVRP